MGGYWSHLWLDMLNLRGADLLWPSPVRGVFPGNPNDRMETGSKAEMVLLIALVLFALLLYPVSGPRGSDLAPYLGRVAAEGEVFVQFWLRPGDEAVELAISEPADRDAIPEVLRDYLKNPRRANA